MRGRCGVTAAGLHAVAISLACAVPCAAGEAEGGGAMAGNERTRFLVLDSRVRESAKGAKLTLGKVTKHEANPLFGEDKPWEKRFDNLYGNVIYDEEEKLHKCWYSPFIVDNSAKGMTLEERQKRYRPPRGREMGVCYATSKDGIKWTKPELTVCEWEGARSNILVRGPHGAGVFKDTRETDPARRYKMFFKGRGMQIAFSADGVRWSEPVRCEGVKVPGDTHNNVLWAPTLRKYVAITRTWGKNPRVREVTRTTTTDFAEWTEPKVVLRGTEPSLQTYAMPVFYHAGVYIGLIALHHQRPVDRVWGELAWSPDTIEWHRIGPGTPLIPNSEEKLAYDYGCVYPCAYPVFLEDEIRLYYGASDYLHYGWRNGFLCLATLRPDGFAGYEPEAPDGRAVITTKPLPRPQGRLRISADVDPGGSVRVSIVDDKHHGLAAYRPVTATATDRKLVPAPGAAAKLEGARLRFELKGATLYSFSFGE
ncbi:MAG: hypothetical protein ACYTKD_24790 [Planctomycetota bacterium]